MTYTLKHHMHKFEALKGDLAKGDGKAGFNLAVLFGSDGNVVTPEKERMDKMTLKETKEIYVKSFKLLENQAKNGDGQAIHYIALYYQSGIPPVTQDMKRFIDWSEKAVAAGYAFAANDLYAVYSSVTSDFYDPVKAEKFSKLLKGK